MKQTRAIHAALKRVLRERNCTYADAAEVLGLSESSVKRLFSTATLSLDRLERLCDWLKLSVADLAALSEEGKPLLTELSPEDERALLADPGLLLCAYLVLNGWTDAEILETFDFTRPQLTRLLVRLERMGLIELFPFDRIRVRAARNFAWRKHGPIQQYFAQRVLPEFLDTRFDGRGEKMHFVGGMLSRRSVLRLHERLDELARELDQLAAEDFRLPAAERFGVSLFAGLRPWEFSEFTRQRRVPRTKFF